MRKSETLVMPSNYVVMNDEEMCYLEGGKSVVEKGTAGRLKNVAATYMACWYALAGGYTYAAAASVASTVGVGVGVGVVAGLTATYCTFAGNEFRQAYNYFSKQKSNTNCKMTMVSWFGILTGVSYEKC